MIVWLDLANAFGSLPHSTLNKLFESLPLPDHTSTILKDMYTNTICEYKDVMVQPTSGVKAIVYHQLFLILLLNLS